MGKRKIACSLTDIGNQNRKCHVPSDVTDGELVEVRKTDGTSSLKRWFSSSGDERLGLAKYLPMETRGSSVPRRLRGRELRHQPGPQRRREKRENSCEGRIRVIEGI